ncbi:MAG: hypothetical protein LKI18_08335 [Prevotella sp.]|nr:hypothetical protein [Prevotella sp.]
MTKQKRIWVGTDKDGLYELDRHFQLIRHYTNIPLSILTLAEDIEGHIWIGSWHEGSGYIDPASGTWHPENLQQGKWIKCLRHHFGQTRESVVCHYGKRINPTRRKES